MTKPVLYFSDHFGVDRDVLDRHGAFDICLRSDSPVFIDPFLLFASDNPELQSAYEEIGRYLKFLAQKSRGELSAAEIREYFHFKESKENWLGFSFMSNKGRGLGPTFATALMATMRQLDPSEVEHVEIDRLSLIEKSGLGRDGVSDFSTQILKNFLLKYTQEFTIEHLQPDQYTEVNVKRAWFDYQHEEWRNETYRLPVLGDEFLILTPIEILTKDETWINSTDMHRQALKIVDACSDADLRGKVERFMDRILFPEPPPQSATTDSEGDNASTDKAATDQDQTVPAESEQDEPAPKQPTEYQRQQAARKAVLHFPELAETYIDLKRDERDLARTVSREKIEHVQTLLEHVHIALEELAEETNLFEFPILESLEEPSAHTEARNRCLAFKRYIEDKDGYKLINRAGGYQATEPEINLFFGLIWFGSRFDLNRETNNGRGPVDNAVSFGGRNKSLVELKLARNKSLKRNLENQVPIYESANETRYSIKLIIAFSKPELDKLGEILEDVNLGQSEDVIVVDASPKVSASKAGVT